MWVHSSGYILAKSSSAAKMQVFPFILIRVVSFGCGAAGWLQGISWSTQLHQGMPWCLGDFWLWLTDHKAKCKSNLSVFGLMLCPWIQSPCIETYISQSTGIVPYSSNYSADHQKSSAKYFPTVLLAFNGMNWIFWARFLSGCLLCFLFSGTFKQRWTFLRLWPSSCPR